MRVKDATEPTDDLALDGREDLENDHRVLNRARLEAEVTGTGLGRMSHGAD